MKMLYIAIGGSCDREDAIQVPLRITEDWAIEDAIAEKCKEIHDYGGDSTQKFSGEFRLDDGPWRKFGAEAEYDVRFVTELRP